MRLAVGLDKAVGSRIIDRRECYSGLGPAGAVKFDYFRNIGVCQNIAVKHDRGPI